MKIAKPFVLALALLSTGIALSACRDHLGHDSDRHHHGHDHDHDHDGH